MTDKRKSIPRELISPSPEFLSASENIGLYWWYWHHKERKITLSPALIRILGHDPDSFDSSIESLYRNVHPDDIRMNSERIAQLISGEISLYEIEYRVKDPKGEWQWYYNRGNVIIRDQGGSPLLTGGISIEISGQFKYLLSMVEEKEKFEYIFRNADDPIFILELLEGKAGKLLDANKAAFELLERGYGEVTKPLPEDLIKDHVIGENGILIQQVVEKGFGRVEQRINAGEKGFLWLDVSAHAFTLTGENLVIAIAKDKTPQKETEAALHESEKLYRTLFESADDPIGLFTVDLEIILINSAFYKTIGYTREEFLSMDITSLVHPDDLDRMKSLEFNMFKDGILTVDCRVKHKKGHYLHMSSKNVLIPGEYGGKDLVLNINRDVTERKRAMEELERAKLRAEESDRLKSAFLANMSHEIRTPMNSIVGFSNLLVNPGLTEEARETYVSRIVRNSELLLTLISDIIDLARIESGQLPIVYGKVSLSGLVRELKLYANSEIERLGIKGVEIIARVNEEDCMIETDLVRVTQVMKNLVNNALKFTEKGSVQIGCHIDREGEVVRLYVQDTGIGISPKDFQVIFEQFRQVDGSNTRKFGGTGLGLAICKNLVELMGGRIWVESGQGKGSLFQAEFPLISARRVKSATPMEPGEPKKRIEPGPVAVMVVDDDQDTLSLFKGILPAPGHQVTTADSGYEALRLLEQSPLPDLIFINVHLPVLSGVDTLRLVKERYRGIIVVALSAHAFAGDRDRFIAEGFDEYLPEPFNQEQVSDLIGTLINEGRPQPLY